MNMFTSSSKNSDNGLKASYNISLLIVKAGKPHTIGEELILPAVKEVIKIVLHKSPERVIKSIPLSDNSVQQRVDKMAKNVEETLSKMLMTTEFSLQLDESTLPGKQIPTSCICTLQGWATVSRIIVCTSPGKRRISVSSCGGPFPEKKHSIYKHHFMCYRWRPVHGWSPLWISKLFEKSCPKNPHSSLRDPLTTLSGKEFEWEATWILIDCDYCSQQNQSKCSQFSTVPSAVYWKWQRFSMPASRYKS